MVCRHSPGDACSITISDLKRRTTTQRITLALTCGPAPFSFGCVSGNLKRASQPLLAGCSGWIPALDLRVTESVPPRAVAGGSQHSTYVSPSQYHRAVAGGSQHSTYVSPSQYHLAVAGGSLHSTHVGPSQYHLAVAGGSPTLTSRVNRVSTTSR